MVVDAITFMYINMGYIIAIVIAWLWSNPYSRVRLLRIFTKKHYGVAKFVTPTKAIVTRVVRMDQDTIKWQESIWTIERNKIYSTKPMSDGTVKRSKEIDLNKQIFYEEGLPTIYFNHNDMMALTFNDTKGEEYIRDPRQVETTLEKERAIATAKALKITKSNLQTLMIISILISVICISLSIILLNDVSAIKNAVFAAPVGV